MYVVRLALDIPLALILFISGKSDPFQTILNYPTLAIIEGKCADKIKREQLHGIVFATFDASTLENMIPCSYVGGSKETETSAGVRVGSTA